jgi:hypothetical protein
MTNRHGGSRPNPVLLLLILWMSAAPLGAADIFLAPEVPGASAPGRVGFDSLVQWDYRHRRKLGGWKHTAQAIRATLDAWSTSPSKARSLENIDTNATKAFIRSLPVASTDEFRVVYLASHQSPRAFWDMPAEGLVPLETLLEGTARDPRRLVVLDTCHASAAAGLTGWTRFAPLCLFACTGGEETKELDLTRRQPVDFARRYPQTVAWLRQHLGRSWNGRLSFLGFVWVRAFQQTPRLPASRQEWQAFLHRCEVEAAAFRAVNRRLASTVRMAVAE